MIEFKFRPWRRFKALKRQRVIRSFIRTAARESEDAFKDGMNGPKSGRVYTRRGRSHKASAAGEYPAKDSGALFKSMRTEVQKDGFEIGTTQSYAIYLREGTSKMARRRMSDDAIREGVGVARSRLRDWAGFDFT